MNIDKRFSKASFESATEAQRRELAGQLEQEVGAILHLALLPAFQAIVAQLSALGHNLRPYADPVPGDISYRDDVQLDGGYSCRLRVGVDAVVSVGYADTLGDG